MRSRLLPHQQKAQDKGDYDLVPAVAVCVSPEKDTVTFSPGAAHPQTETGLSRWRTILDWKVLLTQRPSAMAGTSTMCSRGFWAARVPINRVEERRNAMVFMVSVETIPQL